MSQNILFIGGGNMAFSIIAGLIRHGHSAQNIMASDPEQTKLDALTAEYHIKTSTNNNKFINKCDAIVLAVKPQVLKKVVLAMTKDIQVRKPTILSIAAGVKTTSLEKWLGQGVPIIRAMPNTPALVQQGMSGLFASKTISPAAKNLAQDILLAVGEVIWVKDEELLNAITAISGSGPAYFFLLFEAMQNTALALGLDEKTAQKLITQTALGATIMASSNKLSFADLRANVTSPGGTTEKALAVFADENFKQTVDKALHSAYARSAELAKQLGEQEAN